MRSSIPLPQRPNILRIVADQHRRDCLGLHGHPLLRTPHLDALAREGIDFRQAYTSSPICVPARNSLLHGCWPCRHLSIANADTEAPRPAPADLPAFPQVLREAGYDLTFIGKWLGGKARSPQDYGFRKVTPESAYGAWRAAQGLPPRPGGLPFFGYDEAITPEQLSQVEWMVNDAILEGYPVVTEVLPIEEAKKKGAVAMFGEKYGETVRVVEMGDFSMEFCGGTHLDNSAKAGPFRIKSESSVASGVRRMEATTGRLSLESMEKSHGVLSKAAQFFKAAPSELLERLEQQAGEMKQLRQALEKFKSEASLGEAKQFLAAAKTVKGLHVLTATREGLDANALRKMGDFLRDKDPAVVGVLASISGEKITFLTVCGREAVAKGVKAGDLVKMVSGICGGKGGGKPDSAMGGGSDLLKVDDALAAVDDFVSEKLG